MYDLTDAIEATNDLMRLADHRDDLMQTKVDNLRRYLAATDARNRKLTAERDYLRRWLLRFVTEREINEAMRGKR